MPDSAIKLAVIVLPKSTASASARFYAANRAGRLFFSFAPLNRVNVRGPRSRIPSFPGVEVWDGCPELLKLIGHLVGIPCLILRGSAGPTQNHALQAARGMAECASLVR